MVASDRAQWCDGLFDDGVSFDRLDRHWAHRAFLSTSGLFAARRLGLDRVDRSILLCRYADRLKQHPKLIVYGLNASALKATLRELLNENQVRSEWLGDVVVLPELGIQACVEPAGRTAVSQIHATGKEQSLSGWLTLERMLVQKVSNKRIDLKRQAIVWLLTSFFLFGLATVFVSNDLPRIQQAMSMMFDGDP